MQKYKNRSEVPDEYKWDRTLLIKDKEDYEKKKEKASKLLKQIIDLKGHLLDSAKNLLKYCEKSTELEGIIRDLYVWSNLYKYEDLTCTEGNEYAINAEEFYHHITVETSFVVPEILKNKQELVKKYSEEEPKLKSFAFVFDSIFKDKEHILNEKEEMLIKHLTRSYGKSGDTNEILNDAEGNLGEIIVDEQPVQILQSNFISLLKNRNQKVRQDAFETYFDFYKNHKNTIASLYNTNVMEDNAVALVRKFDSSLAMALNEENIDKSVYENLLKTVKENRNLIFKFQKMRKKILNIKTYHIYDNYLELEVEETKEYTIPKCKEILKEALKPLGEDYLKKLNFMFASKYIDYYPNEGKRSGAFQWHRYVFLNHIDTFDSLTTITHELGHAMNTLYTEEKQPLQYQDNPIFLAEIASTLNEVLLSEYLYQNAKTNAEKRKVLADFLSRVQATIYRQTMFAEFEYKMHKSEQEGTSLTEEFISNEYYKLVENYFDKEVILDEKIKYEWMRIPHFYTSYYVYKYAIGLICALIFAKRILNKEANAVEEYITFLSSGTSDYPLNILKQANIDLTDIHVFNEAFDLINKKIKELEEVMQDE